MVEYQKDIEKHQNGDLKVAVTTCPRCFAEFLCNSANIQQCQCWGVELGPREFSYLESHGFNAQKAGCLCRKCLEEIREEVRKDMQNIHNQDE